MGNVCTICCPVNVTLSYCLCNSTRQPLAFTHTPLTHHPPTHLAPLDLLQRQGGRLPRHHLAHREALVVDGLDGSGLEGAVTNVWA